MSALDFHTHCFASYRYQDLSKVIEKLRVELTEKDGTIATLTRANAEPVSLIMESSHS